MSTHPPRMCRFGRMSRSGLRGFMGLIGRILVAMLCLLATAAMLLFLNAGTAHARGGSGAPASAFQ